MSLHLMLWNFLEFRFKRLLAEPFEISHTLSVLRPYQATVCLGERHRRDTS